MCPAPGQAVSNTAQVTPLQGGGGWGTRVKWGPVTTRYHDIIVLRPVIQFIDICNIHLQGAQEPQRSIMKVLYTSILSYCSEGMLPDHSIHCIKIKDILLIDSTHFIY